MQTETTDQDPLAHGRALLVLAFLTAGFVLAFRVLIELDLAVSHLFYGPNGFLLAGNPIWDGLLMLAKAGTYVFVGAALVGLVANLLRRGPERRLALRYWGLIVLLYLIGPGLLVNGFLKRFYGRARPVNVDVFGGDGPFTGAWEVSNYCHSACSFVSAEVAAATALTVGLCIGAAWFAGRPAGRLFRWLSLASAVLLVLTAIQRIGSGRHFLSDVIFAALPIAALGIALSWMLWPRPVGVAATPTPGPVQ